MAQNKILNVQSVAIPTAIGNLLNSGIYLPAPNQNAIVGSTTGGTLAAATYFYKVTALVNRIDGTTGETTGSNEQQVTNTGATSSNTLSWGAVAGATGYKVYRGTVTNTENVFYTPGNVTTFVDTGAANTGGTVPAINTALPITIPGPTGILVPQMYVVVKHIRVVNRTGSPISVSMYKGASAAQVNGTEYAFAGVQVGANSFQDSYTQSRFDGADFLTGIATGVGLTALIDAEIGVS